MPDIYQFQKRLEKTAEQVKKGALFRKEDTADMTNFYRFVLAKGLSPGRILKYIYTLRTLSKLLKKPFREANKDDIIELVGKIQKSDKWSDWTKRDMKNITKKYYAWLAGIEEDGKYPELVVWITTRMKNKRRLPEEILTEKEIKQLAEAATNKRDRAFILALYESGARIGEFMGLRIKNLMFDDYGCVLRLDGKTGARRVRVVAATPALKTWLEKHPFKTKPNAQLWSKTNNKDPEKRLTYRYVTKLLRRYAKRSGITKRANPHAFRHARATFLANKLTDRQMKEFFGWVKSETISTYTHLSGRETDAAILKIYGKATNNNEQSILTEKVCEKCKTVNDTAAMFCKKCGHPIDAAEKGRVVEDLVFDFLTIIADENPKIKNKFRQLVKERKMEEFFR